MRIKDILKSTAHRPWNIPANKWVYYQEWNQALFLHWKVSCEELQPLIPKGLNLDLYNGDAYVSLVAFTMQKIRPRFLPSFKYISDFNEINLRTYIDNNDKKGVYFLKIEAGKPLSAFVARKLSGLPYEKAEIQRKTGTYKSVNQTKEFSLDAEFRVGDVITEKTGLDKWLTERYSLYLNDRNLFRYEIHHREWELRKVEMQTLNVSYKIDQLDLSLNNPAYMHYSNGVKVLAWPRERV